MILWHSWYDNFKSIKKNYKAKVTNKLNKFGIVTRPLISGNFANQPAIKLYNLKINDERVQENLYITKGQIFAEFVLEALIKKGIPRFIAYRDVQRVAFEAHDKKMDYMDALIKDKAISKSLTEKEVRGIFIPEKHLGASQIIINNVDKHVKSDVKKLSKF